MQLHLADLKVLDEHLAHVGVVDDGVRQKVLDGAEARGLDLADERDPIGVLSASAALALARPNRKAVVVSET